MEYEHGSGSLCEPQEQLATLSEREAFDILFSELDDALRRRASLLCRRERFPSFATGDLLNDLYLRLRRNPAYSLTIAARGRLDFLRVASEAMRRILVDAARHRKQRSLLQFTTLSSADDRVQTAISPEMLLALDEALAALETSHPRRAAILKMRFFGQLSVRELETYFGVSDATVERDIHISLKLLHTLLQRTTN